jgi:hypothetical protein
VDEVFHYSDGRLEPERRDHAGYLIRLLVRKK